MDVDIEQLVDRYITNIVEDKFHRYQSWDNCFEAFNSAAQLEVHSLELAFYLASWGMYRGSSGLLQKTHAIHRGAVDILFSNESQKLRCNMTREVSRDEVSSILKLKNQLAKYYIEIAFTRGATKGKYISSTSTLLSKIILGTLGCVPAYDRYFIEGLKEIKLKHIDFNETSLNELFDFINKYSKEIKQAQNFVGVILQKHYPIMKILDIYFWQIGYEKSLNNDKSSDKI